jgi:hypothetical protein
MIKYTNSQLLDCIKNYYSINHKINQRAFTNKNGLPSYKLYYQRFGSFKSALQICGIPIEAKVFNRRSFTNEELLILLKDQTNIFVKQHNRLMFNNDIDLSSDMPSCSIYYQHFGGIVEAYRLLGIDFYQKNFELIERI